MGGPGGPLGPLGAWGRPGGPLGVHWGSREDPSGSLRRRTGPRTTHTCLRLAGSSGANPFACIAAGIATLWGPAHGGANEAVIRMLSTIEGPKDIPRCLERAKDKSDPYRLMGFGHRVYKNFDPRAKIIRQACHDLLNELDASRQPLFEVAMELERIALEDDYFVDRNLYPNVDFYSGIILQALGIPLNMFTVMFACARTVGWICNWMEAHDDPEKRIGRPRQLYCGHARRDYSPLGERH